jgi:hypothetical protein
VNIALESKHLCLVVCSGTIGVCNPFLVPFMKGAVLLAKRVHGLCRRHLCFNRDEMCFKSGVEIIPTAKVRVCKGKRGLLSVSGPFAGRSAEFEMGESTSNVFAIRSEDFLVEEVVGFEGRPKRFGFAARTIVGFGWRANEFGRGGGHRCQRMGHCCG